jgi:hypothetical protein
MQFNPKSSDGHSPKARDPGRKRVHGRLLQQDLQSNLGTVLDVSAGGLRILSDRPLIGEVTVELPVDEPRVQIAARVIWTKEGAHEAWEVGLQFIGMTPEVSRELAGMATEYGLRMAG